MKTLGPLIGCILSLALTTQADADNDVPRHWIARAGVHPVTAKHDNHPDYRIYNAAGLSVGATYLFSEHWALEFFGAFPVAHELRTTAGDHAGPFQIIPASATLQYHITDAAGVFRGYAGIGVAHASISGERTKGALAGSAMRLDDTTGVAATVGLDMNLGSKWFINVDARWMDVDADLQINEVSQGALEIDPVLFGLSIGRRLR
jgi:outer membrane protein